MVHFNRDSATKRILDGYRELPALALTAAQAARLWGLSPDDCESSLQDLVSHGYLAVTAERRYVATPWRRPASDRPITLPGVTA